MRTVVLIIIASIVIPACHEVELSPPDIRRRDAGAADAPPTVDSGDGGASDTSDGGVD